MKKSVLFGLMVVLSVMVFGLGISAAEEQAVSENMMASIAQERLVTEQTSLETDETLLAETELNCEPYGSDLCEWIENYCCQTSPNEIVKLYCNKNWISGMCRDCYRPCN